MQSILNLLVLAMYMIPPVIKLKKMLRLQWFSVQCYIDCGQSPQPFQLHMMQITAL